MSIITTTMTNDDLHFYRDKGYWISPKLLTDEQIIALRQAHDRVWSNEYDSHGYPVGGSWSPSKDPLKIRKKDNGWLVNETIRQVVTSKELGRIAAFLMECDGVRLWHDQVILKPGAGEQETALGNVGWHQDYGYWQCASTTNMVTVWIALQDTDLTNGGMKTIEESHHWGLIPDSNTFFDQDMDALKNKYASNEHRWSEVPTILKAGHASFHHSLTFHGSGPNLTNQDRLSIVAHLMPDGTCYRSGIQWHPNIPLLGPWPAEGQPFDGPNFPLLYSKHRDDL
ncbi:phytanoyl-CoA dioxygenase family protein [Paenibacillus roseipurpureus]|uniref:Phytanoyl-CoA dioxygenase family protein n=1 Tax=Paenibacillus roseopurpureus TaxID=2918901 RepID=A0AA96LVG2_9BACL|nr:phytanoyl-CoA dioxygenase family protein [Paenibacillus sp. MBLB1832]WNR46828.1 phytanoyl-CoA dioxygenase family protein [Paenibacillus sp. MBLB1832]